MLKRLSLYTLLLCFVPIFTWIIGWQWQNSDQLSKWNYGLYLLTESGSVPYALITCGVFPLLLLPFFKNKKQWVYAVLFMALSVIITQGLKSGLKNAFSEPRPYVVSMTEQLKQSSDQFYQLNRKARSTVVTNFYRTQTNTPEWLKSHYQKEVGYSFPSGHSIFAAGWLMLVIGVLTLLKQKGIGANILISITFLWAVLMLISRLRLGMHYPIDLLVSVLLAWLVNSLLFALFAKYLNRTK